MAMLRRITALSMVYPRQHQSMLLTQCTIRGATHTVVLQAPTQRAWEPMTHCKAGQ